MKQLSSSARTGRMVKISNKDTMLESVRYYNVLLFSTQGNSTSTRTTIGNKYVVSIR